MIFSSPLSPQFFSGPEVPATSVQELAYTSAGKPVPSKTNAARHAWRKFDKLNFGWQVKMSNLCFPTGDGDETLDVPYMNPIDTLQYLMQHDPSVVVGGICDQQQRALHLQAFWRAYRDVNPHHPVFSEHGSNLSRVIPICYHGDEGRGKKRGMTAVISIEAVIGIYTSWHIKTGTKKCSDCGPSRKESAYFPKRAAVSSPSELDTLIESQCTNMKGHSHLQHWPVFILPGAMYKHYKPLLPMCFERLAFHLRQGFYEGFDVPQLGAFFTAVVGSKGDLKWFVTAANLCRSFEHMGRVRDILMRHECNSGTSQLPFEDVTSDHPCWENTVYSTRPWDQTPALARVPYDMERPEAQFRRDVFHLTKVGVYRDFVASSILLLTTLGYFGANGTVDVKLERAYHVFRLYCQTTSQSPGLRSFNRRFFNYPTAANFAYTNSKGSDTIMLTKWLLVFTTGCQNDLSDPAHVEILNLIYFTAEAAVNFFRIMNTHGLFLRAPCMIALWKEVRCFIRGYSMLAWKSHTDLGFKGFGIKPKLHLLRHAELEAYQKLMNPSCTWFANPIMWGCESNEDYIGRACRLSRRCSTPLLCTRVLQSLMLKGDLLNRRWLKSGPGRSGKKKSKVRTALKWLKR